MTLFEWFVLLPIWIRVVILTFIFSHFFMSYSNLINIKENIKKMVDLMEEILEVSNRNKDEFLSAQQILSLFLLMNGKNKNSGDLKNDKPTNIL